ncbi:START domain-containing protein [Mucilaginibacter sp. RS28]|uniref:START domain-containing protein n=1 Tax=Mucilaginibacter straminoryzae TaxID=2932774 RepID=A0A9X1X631_9SPHI|nr:START domain-containing protein [Mucilaginibacter straminoryzae]MCJ8211646.1 START domain-containing protein [Mucilaginibacter straminoryzae]
MLRRLFFTLGFALCVSQLFAQTTWTLNTEKEGIKVYTSPVPDSKVKALRVECEYKTTLSQLVAVLLDVKGCTEWVYHTKSATLIKQVSPSELYYYSEINLPWPTENRDFVAHLIVQQNPDTKVVTMDGPAVPGFVAVKKGIVRIDHSKGRWVLTPSDGKVKVEYTLHVDPAGAIPAWLVNLLAAEGPIQSFKALRTQLQKPQYQNAGYSFIKN